MKQYEKSSVNHEAVNSKSLAYAYSKYCIVGVARAGADAWVSDFRFVRDGVILTSAGGYSSKANTWEVLRLERLGNVFMFNVDNVLRLTYVENDIAASPVIGVGIHAGWLVTIKYDYISITSTPE